MISEIQIQNFKSIQDLKLKLGRVTVLIGENGSGKSNILEAIAFAGCAAADKLDNEYLAPRGIRVTEARWMVSAFPNTQGENQKERGMQFCISDGTTNQFLSFTVCPIKRDADNSFLKWIVNSQQFGKGERNRGEVLPTYEGQIDDVTVGYLQRLKMVGLAIDLGLTEFIIYSPENTTLRKLSPESAIQPLGKQGEGLIKLLQSFTDEKFKEIFQDLQSRLRLFGWFEDFLPPDALADLTSTLHIHDRWLAPDRAVFDQRSANEGFLFVLFYFTVLMSWRTPMFFAIDNIDTALNPKLCSTLMAQVVELAKKYGKQVICTTHNPAILDGLNLKDDEQRLYTVSRDSEGHTKLRRVTAPEPQAGEPPVRLSEAFQRGLIGGLPDNF